MSESRYVVRPKADRDLDDQAYYYATEATPEVGHRFLVAAHDTGGAIRGAVRADFFWGTGESAGIAAGRMRQNGKLWLLWPRGAPLPRLD